MFFFFQICFHASCNFVNELLLFSDQYNELIDFIYEFSLYLDISKIFAAF